MLIRAACEGRASYKSRPALEPRAKPGTRTSLQMWAVANPAVRLRMPYSTHSPTTATEELS